MSDLLELRPKPTRKPLPQPAEKRSESTAAPSRSKPSRKRWPSAKPLLQKQIERRPLHRANSKRSEKLQQYKRTSNLELLRRSAPATLPGKKLSNRLYVDGVALPARRVGSLAIVWRQDYQGYQLFSWELRSPLSSVLFETQAYCCEAAVELEQRFDIDSVLRLQPFGAMEGVDAIIKGHWVREQVALGQP